jgi:hypothetical protein
MWIVKGSLLGILMFAIIFGIRFRKVFIHSIIGPGVIPQMTLQSVMFWIGLIGCVMVGCTIVWYWTPSAWPGHGS